MISDALIIASCSFGSALFGLFAGIALAGFRQNGSHIFPPTHVGFDPDLSDSDRLRFLDEAVKAVRDGRLREPYRPQDDCPSNHASKPGADLEN